jgi:hypothetical protein
MYPWLQGETFDSLFVPITYTQATLLRRNSRYAAGPPTPKNTTPNP